MTASRGGVAQSIQVRLVQHAKATGVDPNLVLTRYAVERFLYRLSRSQHADRFVLKGAMLVLAWLGETLRPTRDADLLGLGDLSDDTLLEIIKQVCRVDVEPDAVIYDADTVGVEPIREENAYGGWRVSVQASLGPAKMRVRLDVGIGDAVTPAAEWLDYPSLLGMPRPRLRAYARETVVAEKLHAMVLLGARNSRMKDYFDVHALVREGALDTRQLAAAIVSTFKRRETPLPAGVPTGLTDAFASDPDRQARWRAFLRKNRLLGPDLPQVVNEVRAYLDPVLAAITLRH